MKGINNTALVKNIKISYEKKIKKNSIKILKTENETTNKINKSNEIIL